MDQPTPTLPSGASTNGLGHSRGGWHWTVVCALVAGVMSAVLVFRNISEREEERAEAAFERDAEHEHQNIAQELAKFRLLVEFTQRTFDATPARMTNEVNAAAELMRARGLPLFSLQWAPRVTAAGREAFEAELRAAQVPFP